MNRYKRILVATDFTDINVGVLGSTAIGILNGATCDVLSVREPDEAV